MVDAWGRGGCVGAWRGGCVEARRGGCVVNAWGAWWMRGGVVDAWRHGFKMSAFTTCSVTGWSRSPGLRQSWSFTWVSADNGAMSAEVASRL